MAKGCGGARPGAGGKRDVTKERQVANRDQLLAIGQEIYPSDNPEYANMSRSEAFARSLFTRAMLGDPIATANLIPFLFGGRPRAPLVEVNIDARDQRQQAVIWGIAWQPPDLTESQTLREVSDKPQMSHNPEYLPLSQPEDAEPS